MKNRDQNINDRDSTMKNEDKDDTSRGTSNFDEKGLLEQPDEGALPDDWFDDEIEEEEGPPPLMQRKGFRKLLAVIFSLALVANILAFWPQVYSLAAIQFLIKSRELSQSAEIQQYKESVVTVRTGDSKGTGFTVTEDGFIITNHHVIDGGQPITVAYPDGKLYHADVLFSDPRRDIAILDIEAEDLPTLDLVVQGDGTEGLSGEPIYVIGNPLFFNQIANEGQVVGYMLQEDGELLLIDAPIYKGNSGSPVINQNGQVIGVVFATSRVDLNGKSTKVGLAVPISDVQKYLQDLDVNLVPTSAK